MRQSTPRKIFLPLLLLAAAAQGQQILPDTSPPLYARWPEPKMVLNYYFPGTSPSGVPYEEAFKEAAQSWGEVFTFELNRHFVDLADPNTCPALRNTVGEFGSATAFSPGFCGDTFPPEAMGATVVYCEFPPQGGELSQGLCSSEPAPGAPLWRIRAAYFAVNIKYPWDVYDGLPRDGVEDFTRVLAHELGHMLGLSHALDDPNTLMWPYYGSVRFPTKKDLDLARSIYAHKAPPVRVWPFSGIPTFCADVPEGIPPELGPQFGPCAGGGGGGG